MASNLVKARVEKKELVVSPNTFRILKGMVDKNPTFFNHDPEANKIGKINSADIVDGELVFSLTIFKKENSQ